MDISLLIHEGARRGISFEAGATGLQILATPGEVDDGFRSLISAHKAEIEAYFTGRPAEFSPHDSSFSPLSSADLSSGLNATPSVTSQTTSFSPLSPLEKREEVRVWGKQNNDREEHGLRRDSIPVCNDSPLRESGLSGLFQRNSLEDNEVAFSPEAEKCGLNEGLNLLEVDSASLRSPIPPTWEELSSLRWGPAMDPDRPWVPAEDDTPGIVIDTPDRGRLLAALRSRFDGGQV